MLAEVFENIKEISESEWDSLITKNETFVTHRYLQMVEETSPSCYKFWYIKVKENDVTVALISLFSMPVHLDMLSALTTKSIIGKIRKISKKFLTICPLFVGSPPSLGNSTVIINDTVNKYEVLTVINRTVERIAENNKLNLIIYKEFELEQCTYTDILSNEHNYLKIASLPTNKLMLKWSNFENYLRALKKGYRQSINSSNKKLQNEFLKVVLLYNFNDIFNDYHYKLYESVLGKAEVQLEKLTIDYFRKIADIPNAEACLISLTKDDIILGYILVCNSGKDSISAMFA